MQKHPETHGEHVCGIGLLQPIGHDVAHAWYSFNGSEHCEPHSLGSTQREFGLLESNKRYGTRHWQPGVQPIVAHLISGFVQLAMHPYVSQKKKIIF